MTRLHEDLLTVLGLSALGPDPTPEAVAATVDAVRVWRATAGPADVRAASPRIRAAWQRAGQDAQALWRRATPPTATARQTATRDRRPPKAARAIGYVEQVVTEWYATPDGDGYVDVVLGDGPRRTIRARSREMRALVDRMVWEAEQVGLGGQARQDVLDVLDARARHSGTVRELAVRVAEHGGEIWIDLCDQSWRAIRVTRDGWSVVQSHHVPVRFRRSRGMRPLPVPVPGGEIDELREYVRVDRDAYTLLVAWLLGALHPRGPYVVLVLHGEQGSGKSTTARRLRSLLDPHEVPLRAPPRDERDIAIGAINQHILGMDNLSHLPPWLSDALCRIATGGGYATRELYTDGDEYIISATRPIVLTGIESVATRGDLADRAYAVELVPIPDAERRTEAEIDARWRDAAPRILGALLDAAVVGLRRMDDPAVLRAHLPRMADAARWVIACEPACPWRPGEYLAAYSGVRAEMISHGVEGDPVASANVEHVDAEGGRWQGTAGELLAALDRRRGDARPPRGWPETPRALSGRLTRAAPLLRHLGVEIERRRVPGGSRTRIIAVERRECASDRPYRPDRPNASADAGSGRDDRGDDTTPDPPYRPGDRPAETPHDARDWDDRDDRDGTSHTLPVSPGWLDLPFPEAPL